MDKEKEIKDKTISFLTDKTGTSHKETKKQTWRRNITNILDKLERVSKRLEKNLINTD